MVEVVLFTYTQFMGPLVFTYMTELEWEKTALYFVHDLCLCDICVPKPFLMAQMDHEVMRHLRAGIRAWHTAGLPAGICEMPEQAGTHLHSNYLNMENF